jgi:hypothetical protein
MIPRFIRLSGFDSRLERGLDFKRMAIPTRIRNVDENAKATAMMISNIGCHRQIEKTEQRSRIRYVATDF